MSDWEEPLPLLECINNKLKINDDTAKLLQEIDKPMVVVTIAGLYRTGKSYLMNRLAGKNAGFSLGATVQSHTKGIWAWKVQHPLDDDKVLLLMDTEGLGDPMKGDLDYDTWICCLSILLSSVFVYNIMGVIRSSTIDQLSFTLEMSRHIRAKSRTDSDVQLDEYFPTLILAIRDLCLTLKTEKEVTLTPDEYLEEILTMTKTKTKAGQKHNEIRQKIRLYFKQRKCFCFTRPTSEDKDLHHLETISDEMLTPTFLKSSNKFCDYIFRHAPVKRVDYSQTVKGRTFIQFVNIYLNAINCGTIPCIETALSAIKRQENEKAINESLQLYEEKFRNLTAFPVPISQLMDVHEDCYRYAVALFCKNVFLDEGQEYHACLQERLNEKYIEFAKENNKISSDKCKELLQILFAMINYNVEDGFYIKPGGYELYIQDIQDVELRYCAAYDLGPLAETVWLDTLKDKELQRAAVLHADQSLTEIEQQAKAEEAKRQEIEKQAEIKKQKMEGLKLHQKMLMKAHQEHLQNLEDLYRQREQEQEEQFQKTMAERQREQKRLMEDQFEKEAQVYQTQLNELKVEQTSNTKRIFGAVLGIGGSILSIIPHPVTRVIGLGLGLFGSLFR